MNIGDGGVERGAAYIVTYLEKRVITIGGPSVLSLANDRLIHLSKQSKTRTGGVEDDLVRGGHMSRVLFHSVWNGYRTQP